jgi:hypothetical protein
MKSLFRSSAAIFAGSVLAFSAHAATAGYVDIGKFQPAEGCQFVEVNLHASMLKFASVFVDKNEPEIADLIRAVKHVRVNVVGYDESTRADTTHRVENIRRELEGQGWTQMVTVKDTGESNDVAVYVKMAADDTIDGIVVTVIDSGKREVVFVNLVGNIKPEQVAMIGKRLNIEPLSQLSSKLNKKSV